MSNPSNDFVVVANLPPFKSKVTLACTFSNTFSLGVDAFFTSVFVIPITESFTRPVGIVNPVLPSVVNVYPFSSAPLTFILVLVF